MDGRAGLGQLGFQLIRLGWHLLLHPARMSVNGPVLPPSSGTNCLTLEQMCLVFKRGLSDLCLFLKASQGPVSFEV